MKTKLSILLAMSLVMAVFCGNFIPQTSQEAAKAVALGQTIESVNVRTVIWGINQAISGKLGTYILQNGNKYIFIWYSAERWMFTCVDAVSKSGSIKFNELFKTGNAIVGTRIIDFIDAAKNFGWTVVTPKNLDPKIVAAAGTAASWLSEIAATLTTFLIVLPVGNDGKPIQFVPLTITE